MAEILRGVGLTFDQQVAVGDSIYKPQKLRADFVVRNLVWFPRGLAIESKWQDSAGSIDEKFPYLALNIQTRYTVPAIVIVAGGACRAGALEWLRDQCDGERLVDVFHLEEFISWAFRSEKR